jgi:hypothetical protein
VEVVVVTEAAAVIVILAAVVITRQPRTRTPAIPVPPTVILIPLTRLIRLILLTPLILLKVVPPRAREARAVVKEEESRVREEWEAKEERRETVRAVVDWVTP